MPINADTHAPDSRTGGPTDRQTTAGRMVYMGARRGGRAGMGVVAGERHEQHPPRSQLDALQGAGMHDHALFTAAGVLAVFVIGAGSLMWVLSGHMAVRRRRRALLARLQSAPRRGAAHAAPVGSATLVTVDGSTRYHRPSCVLVEGRAHRPVKGTGSRSGGLRRCEMCES